MVIGGGTRRIVGRLGVNYGFEGFSTLQGGGEPDS
jgi:hypothetical protein